MSIRFGTDGWRAVIADDFTFANVERVSQALADFLRSDVAKQHEDWKGVVEPGTVVVGYDRRFLSDRFAMRAAEVMVANGFRVLFFDQDYPTPFLSYELVHRGLTGGIVITASHNPPEFSGFKFKAPFGGSAAPVITRELEALLGATSPKKIAFEQGIEERKIQRISLTPAYRQHVRSLVNLEEIRAANVTVIVDPMYGAGGRWVESFLGGGACKVITIHADRDARFGGVHPEPVPQSLRELSERVRSEGALCGLATDGDADRVGAVHDTGEYMNTHQILAILLLHLARHRGWTGGVVRTFSQSVLVKRIAHSLGFELHETPIGFKYIAELMRTRDILIGGEESGGIGVKGHIPERDGVLNSLLLFEALVASGQKPSQLIRDMWKEFGEFHYDRRDLRIPIAKGQELVARLAGATPSTFAGEPVAGVETLDGSKLVFDDESWILFRQSGTEPVLRIYSEATSEARVENFLQTGVEMASA